MWTIKMTFSLCVQIMQAILLDDMSVKVRIVRSQNRRQIKLDRITGDIKSVKKIIHALHSRVIKHRKELR